VFFRRIGGEVTRGEVRDARYAGVSNGPNSSG
jgi:hypothetical protein